MKKLFAFDLVVLGYLAVITGVVLAARPEGAGIYLAYHLAVLVLLALLVHAYERFGGRFWTLLRYWYVVVVVLASFRELHYLVPDVHPFDDFRYDKALAALDRRWLGDVDGFVLSLANPFFIDVLHLCYWFYFASILIPGGVLYARGEFGKLREYVSVVLTGLYLSYLGYLAVPAVGPHHFHRPPEMDGWVLGGPLHEALIAIEWRMPDAFPSGHALMSMVVIVLAWRHHRPTFRWIVFPAGGCILATVALRYHYVVDLAASAALLPVAVALGTALHRRWEGRAAAPGAISFLPSEARRA